MDYSYLIIDSIFPEINIYQHFQAIFLYSCQSCLAQMNNTGWTTWAIWAATKEVQPQKSLSNENVQFDLQVLYTD